MNWGAEEVEVPVLTTLLMTEASHVAFEVSGSLCVKWADNIFPGGEVGRRPCCAARCLGSDLSFAGYWLCDREQVNSTSLCLSNFPCELG